MAVTFTDISGGSPTSWLWEFGDDSTSTKQKPTHVYNKPGEYAVKLTVTNGCGAKTLVKESYISVNPCLPPDANFSATVVSGNAPLTVQFVDESTGDPTAWSWDFGDGATST
ncbi:PKD domain-containing protein, partial [Cytophagia bacterium CHB2]|nr:PKD domain-containing protein [Cytophagia bacterium CHB2]